MTMGELVIQLIAGLLLPVTFLILGLIIWKTHPPMGDMFGYRTKWSRKNERLWDMGQELFGRYLTITYAVILGISVITNIAPMILHIDKLMVSVMNSAMYLVQFTAFFAVAGVTDGRLKRAFKKDGEDDND